MESVLEVEPVNDPGQLLPEDEARELEAQRQKSREVYKDDFLERLRSIDDAEREAAADADLIKLT